MLLRALIRFSFLLLPFVAAGRLDWWNGWLFLGAFAVSMGCSFAILCRYNPEIIRIRMGKIRLERSWDRFVVASSVALSIVMFIVAALDSGRYGWSQVPRSWSLAACLFHFAGMVPGIWASAVNKFLETTVRIQTDRGHYVVTGGPYRLVRHPMYSGLLVANLAWPAILGSLWGLIPAVLIDLLFIYRTVREDRTLREELEGYEEYTRRTPYRLVYGIW